jgi:septal ring factor EnvC (AmiA/AmiB activator)
VELAKLIPELTPGALGIWLFGFLLVSTQLLKWAGEYRALRKLPLDQRQANREGFAAQVELLQKQLAGSDEENRRTRVEIRQLRNDYDRYRRLCHDETHQLRQQIIRLEDDLAGYRRQRDTATLHNIRQGGQPPVGDTDPV